jgi:glutamine phosphoribosylpyrophosphate amidotransferase
MGIALNYYRDKEANCVEDTKEAILQINHTGQEHCGIMSFNGKDFRRITNNGLVRELEIPNDMKGYCGIGNVSKLHDHQPLETISSSLPNVALTSEISLLF